MSTSVRVPRESSKKLDVLAARILLRTGRKVSKQDLIELILEAGLDEEALLARILGIQLPVPDKVWTRLRDLPVDWGVETREEDIDRVLYGASE